MSQRRNFPVGDWLSFEYGKVMGQLRCQTTPDPDGLITGTSFGRLVERFMIVTHGFMHALSWPDWLSYLLVEFLRCVYCFRGLVTKFVGCGVALGSSLRPATEISFRSINLSARWFFNLWILEARRRTDPCCYAELFYGRCHS